MAIDNAILYHEARNAISLREDVLAIASNVLKNPLGDLQKSFYFLFSVLD